MRAAYLGNNDPLELLHGKVYDVIEVDNITGWYRIVDETGDDYLFPPEDFEIITPLGGTNKHEKEIIRSGRITEEESK